MALPQANQALYDTIPRLRFAEGVRAGVFKLVLIFFSIARAIRQRMSRAKPLRATAYATTDEGSLSAGLPVCIEITNRVISGPGSRIR